MGLKIKKRHWVFVARILASVGTGILLATAYPPFESPEAAWVGLIPLLLLCRWTKPGHCFYWGLLAGSCFWLISLSWLLSLYNTWGYLPVVILAWLAISFYCAIYFALFTLLSSHVIRSWPVLAGGNGRGKRVGWLKSSVRGLGVMAAVTAFWVGMEFFRSILFSGFPWNGLGVSQYQKVAFIQFAEVGGVYLVSGLMVFVNAAIALTTVRIVVRSRNRGYSSGMHLELMVGLLVWLLFWVWGIRLARMSDRNLMREAEAHIACIQPGISQDRKWSGRPEYTLNIYDKLQQYTRVASIGGPDLIIWPETAVPGYIGGDSSLRDEYAMDFVENLAREFGPLLAGAMEAVPRGGENLYYNSSFLFNRSGDIQKSYRKKHLVPFGEYLPFENVFPLIKRFAPLGWSCTSGKTGTVFELALDAGETGTEGAQYVSDLNSQGEERGAGKTTEGARNELRAKFSVLICFEDVFAYLSRNAVRDGAEILINQTNDAWFDGSAGLEQHLSHSVFRCVENRVPAVRCANTGITCHIDPVGRIDAFELRDSEMSRFEGADSYRVKFRKRRDTRTFYSRFGDLPFAVPCAAVSIIYSGALLLRWRKDRCKRRSGKEDA